MLAGRALNPLVRLQLTTPVAFTRTSEWGQRGDRFHHGIDLYAAYATPVRAAASGVVTASVANGAPGYARYGVTVRVQHDDGTEALYAHLSSRVVQQGQRIDRGQLIGFVGDTRGTTTNPDATFEVSEPHVHFEVLVGNYPASAGGPDGTGPVRTMDPRLWFRSHGQELGNDPLIRVNTAVLWVGGGLLTVGVIGLAWLYRKRRARRFR